MTSTRIVCAVAALALTGALACGSGDRGAERVRTDPDFYAPFLISQAIRAGDLLFVSGQAAVDENGAVVGPGDFDAQAEQVFRNLEAVLHAGGSDLSRVVKVTIYVTDMAVFPKILELRERYFRKPYPADTIVEIAALGLPELLLEIDAIAIVDGAIDDASG